MSREGYRRVVVEFLQAGGAPTANSQQDVTVAEVMAAYIRFAKIYYRKNGKVTREYSLIGECCRLIKPLYGRSPAVEFGPLALKAVRQTMIEAGHSRKYINKNIERIRRMYKWAAGEEVIPASVPQSLSMVTGLRRGRTTAKELPPILPVSDDVIEATLSHLPEVVADLVRLNRLCGARPGEVCCLRPCDLDRDSDVWIFKPESHKMEHYERQRIIFIGPKAQGILLRYLARDSQGYCFRPIDSEAKRRAVRHASRKTPLGWGNKPGSNRKRKPKRTAGYRYDVASYRRAIHRACEKAQIEKWSPNRLRHAAATEVRRKFGLEAAQVILGHAHANVTQVYAQRDMACGVEVAKRIGYPPQFRFGRLSITVNI